MWEMRESTPLGKESNRSSIHENSGVDFKQKFLTCRTQLHPSK